MVRALNDHQALASRQRFVEPLAVFTWDNAVPIARDHDSGARRRSRALERRVAFPEQPANRKKRIVVAADVRQWRKWRSQHQGKGRGIGFGGEPKGHRGAERLTEVDDAPGVDVGTVR